MNRRSYRLRNYFVVSTLCAIAGVFVVMLFLFDPAHYSFYPACYFHLITGFYCPGCGGLRATHEVLHGDFAAAARSNLLLMLSLPVAGLGSVRSIRPLCIWIFIVACVVFTVARNVPGGEWLLP